MKKFQLLFLLVFNFSFWMSAQEYPRVILSGDYADPTIVRDGPDYYMTHSPFYYMPGFLIWHSQDLVNWQPVSRVVPEYEGTAYAPELIKHKGRFYLYFPSNGTNYVVWADDIRGPWSKPVDTKVTHGIDPGHVVGEDGKRYLFINDGRMAPLSDDGLSCAGELKKVYEGWDFPKSWKTEGKWLESPKFIKKGEYYYLISAQGGTAGPATSHMIVVARSKSIHGPWENSPYNPLVHTYSANDIWWSKGHGTVIDDVNGNWWVVYHAYANGYHTLGRQTLLEPVEWTADGWLKTKPTAEPIVPQQRVKHGMELSDDFSSAPLGLQWTFWKEYAPEKTNINKGVLTVDAKGTTPADARLLLTTATDKNYAITVEVTPQKGSRTGLVLFYSEKAYAGILTDGKQFYIYKDAETKPQIVPNKLGKTVFLRILNQGNKATFLISKDKQNWTVLAERVDVSMMHHNKYNGFYALRPALVSSGKGQSRFRQFTYKNAVPQEKDMSAYLMVFHKDNTHSLHMALSNDGYTFTALNDGNPVISGDTIADQKGIRDPHIYRGPDGAFYLAMTDLHIYAKQAGLRDTEWEREGYGWGNNRGLVLMKSWDLINWTRTNIRFNELSARFKEIGCAWAPETTCDEEAGKLMIYFTMRYRNEAAKLYYVYVNEDYNRLESVPKILFEYPNENVTALDADITKIGDKYRMFYVSHDGQAGIKQAVSDKATGGYFFDPRWYDPEPKVCEAPNVWKRIGEEKWVLMYDCYGQAKHNFGFSETSDFANFTNLGHFNEGVMKTTNFESPKHGAIIHLTKEEAEKLAKRWNLNMEFKTSEEFRKALLTNPGADLSKVENHNNPVLPGSYADPEVLYSHKTGKYYIYPTSDGFKHWAGTYFKAFSSDDLKNWKDEGVILDLKKDVSWADRNAWAPSIIEKKDKNGNYKYYYYFTAAQRIGVAVADHPTGPFVDSGKPLIDKFPEGMDRGQNIDPDVFQDPKSGKTYLYWGNYFMAVCELNDDMVSVKENTTKVLIPNAEFHSEGVYVFYRDGNYYFTWSKNDTRSPDYQVRYVKSASPTGPIDSSKGEIILSKDESKGIYGTGHHSVLQVPGKDEWYMVYHRFKRPDGIKMGRDAGYNREVCIDKLEFDKNGNIKKVIPTI